MSWNKLKKAFLLYETKCKQFQNFWRSKIIPCENLDFDQTFYFFVSSIKFHEETQITNQLIHCETQRSTTVKEFWLAASCNSNAAAVHRVELAKSVKRTTKSGCAQYPNLHNNCPPFANLLIFAGGGGVRLVRGFWSEFKSDQNSSKIHFLQCQKHDHFLTALK